ncbi:MAG: hypothetical protein ACJA01_002230 [Saprospiraceae bacterium]|jgi:hypothetical protein
MQMQIIFKYCFVLIGIYLIAGCNKDGSSPKELFYKLSETQSKVNFENELDFDKRFNIYKYRNFYNGGGVAIGDVNNDGWMDLYFTANMRPNHLYINNGDLSFREVAEEFGVDGNGAWSTGVAMVDINGDGWTDIYVCNSGDIEGDDKKNELFINQEGKGFVEEAEKYGLADEGLTTHIAFFDYDKDGDLDCYLLNNSFEAIGSFNLKKNERPNRSIKGGDKFFRNNNGYFEDISEEAGIYGSVIGFGLGVTVGDIDQDGWQDIFVSNDFFERDYIYMNNGDGTFTENLEEQMKSISGASMGADMADINNDGFPEIFVTEMLPQSNKRLKTKTTFENWDRYQYSLNNGYYHQFTRNMFHLNNGDDTFSEVGRLLGVEATDWSWGALINDYDNDGLKDLFIANGIHKDLTDQDYINYISTQEMAESVISQEGVDFKKLTDVIPSNKISNYMYQNLGNLKFKDVTEDWGLDMPSHSNGSAYVDIDNDGDLDLVINNLDDLASIYINQSESVNESGHYIKLIFKGIGKNTQGIGAHVEVHVNGQIISYEQMPVKGFQSSVDPRLNIGVGSNNMIDSLKVLWNDGLVTTLFDIEVDQILTLEQKNSTVPNNALETESSEIFRDITSSTGIDFIHTENEFVDFDRDRLMYHMLSVEGPALCLGDLNGDGLEDIYIGGAKDHQGSIYLQEENGAFSKHVAPFLAEDAISEDVDCACMDVDGDGDQDLYVASGGNEFPSSSGALIDRLYINNGKGVFEKSKQILPSFKFENTSTVAPSDIDGDGDIDLFIGVRAKPFLVGVPTDGYLLKNDGSGVFEDVTKIEAPFMKGMGMVTDAVWSDIDGDNDDDLIVVGEWMQITMYENQNGILEEISDRLGLDSTNGWWNRIEAADLDHDGDIDFVIGNHGLNSRFRASKKEPVLQYVNDFDQNGTAEVMICTYENGAIYPLVLKHDLVMQIPSLKKKYLKYERYQDQTIFDVFTEEQLVNSSKSEAYIMESVVLINEGEQGFSMHNLPVEAQFSPVYGIAINDFDKDGHLDIVLGGNFYNAKPEVGRYDASYGAFLKGDGQGSFKFAPNSESGLKLEDQIRRIALVQSAMYKELLIVVRNNTSALAYKY